MYTVCYITVNERRTDITRHKARCIFTSHRSTLFPLAIRHRDERWVRESLLLLSPVPFSFFFLFLFIFSDICYRGRNFSQPKVSKTTLLQPSCIRASLPKFAYSYSTWSHNMCSKIHQGWIPHGLNYLTITHYYYIHTERYTILSI